MNEENSGGRDGQTSGDGIARKPYVPPSLRVYGDIAELTRTFSNIGNTDGGSGNMKKTG
jgi:hypothetical protein